MKKSVRHKKYDDYWAGEGGGINWSKETENRLCPCEGSPHGPPPSVVAPVSVNFVQR